MMMKNMLLAGISAVGVVVAASGSAWAFTEFEAAFMPEDPLAKHRILATSCKKPAGFRRIRMKGGTRFAKEGEVFAFEPRVIRAKRCEEIEIVFENADAVRHALMVPNLSPMFMLEFTGRGERTARFVAPDQDITLEFHCHVETHEKMGMHGTLIVGKGDTKTATTRTQSPAATRLYEGVGIVVAVQPREGRLVIDHEEIEDFMAAMVMGYAVIPPTLLQGIEAGRKVRFTIDADKRALVAIIPITE